MRAAGLVAHHRIHRVVTTKANPQAQVVENVLNRQFQVEQPNRKWVADVTYIATAQGWM
jgi:transposase InsO family protein